MLNAFIVTIKKEKKKLTYSVLAPNEDFIRKKIPEQLGGEIESIEPNQCCMFKLSEEEE